MFSAKPNGCVHVCERERRERFAHVLQGEEGTIQCQSAYSIGHQYCKYKALYLSFVGTKLKKLVQEIQQI